MLCEHGNISPCLECDIGPLKAENEKLSKDVAELVEVLEMMLQMVEMGGFGKDAAMETALAAHRKQGGEV